MKKLMTLLALGLIFVGTVQADSPSTDSYIRKNLLKAIQQDNDAQGKIKDLLNQTQSQCFVDSTPPKIESSVSFNFQNKTFAIHYQCEGALIGLDVKGRFTPKGPTEIQKIEIECLSPRWPWQGSFGTLEHSYFNSESSI